MKPEWLEHERLGACSDAARVLSMGLVLLADDHGNGRASPVYLAGQVWPYADRGVAERVAYAEAAFEELCRPDVGYAVRYEVDGAAYYNLPGWARHQRIDNAGKPRCPLPPRLAATRGEIPRTAATLGDLPPDHDHDLDHDLDHDQVRSEPKARRSRKQPAVALLADWKPNTAHHALATELGVRVLDEAIQFRDHAEATGRRAVSWDAAFRNWLRRAALYAARGAGGAGGGGKPGTSKPERYHAVRDRTAYADPEIERKGF